MRNRPNKKSCLRGSLVAVVHGISVEYVSLNIISVKFHVRSSVVGLDVDVELLRDESVEVVSAGNVNNSASLNSHSTISNVEYTAGVLNASKKKLGALEGVIVIFKSNGESVLLENRHEVGANASTLQVGEGADRGVSRGVVHGHLKRTSGGRVEDASEPFDLGSRGFDDIRIEGNENLVRDVVHVVQRQLLGLFTARILEDKVAVVEAHVLHGLLPASGFVVTRGSNERNRESSRSDGILLPVGEPSIPTGIAGSDTVLVSQISSERHVERLELSSSLEKGGGSRGHSHVSTGDEIDITAGRRCTELLLRDVGGRGSISSISNDKEVSGTRSKRTKEAVVNVARSVNIDLVGRGIDVSRIYTGCCSIIHSWILIQRGTVEMHDDAGRGVGVESEISMARSRCSLGCSVAITANEEKSENRVSMRGFRRSCHGETEACIVFLCFLVLQARFSQSAVEGAMIVHQAKHQANRTYRKSLHHCSD